MLLAACRKEADASFPCHPEALTVQRARLSSDRLAARRDCKHPPGRRSGLRRVQVVGHVLVRVLDLSGATVATTTPHTHTHTHIC